MALRDVLLGLREARRDVPEATAKFQFIMPILQEIGWNFSDPSQVAFEYAVQGAKKGYVDIALRAPRRGNVALIEAKAPAKRLDDHVTQVLEYAFVDGVDICVLTNGLEWWLYLPRERGLPAERRFAVLNITSDPIDQLVDDFETYLARLALLDRSAEQRAKQALRAGQEAERLQIEMPKIWEQMQAEPDHDLVELIAARVFRSLRLRPTPEQIGAMFRGDPIGPGEDPPPPPSPPSPPPPPPPPSPPPAGGSPEWLSHL